MYLGYRLYDEVLVVLEKGNLYILRGSIPPVLYLHRNGNVLTLSTVRFHQRDGAARYGQRILARHHVNLGYPTLVGTVGQRVEEAGNTAIGSL